MKRKTLGENVNKSIPSSNISLEDDFDFIFNFFTAINKSENRYKVTFIYLFFEV